jgi:hypothetical protein
MKSVDPHLIVLTEVKPRFDDVSSEWQFVSRKVGGRRPWGTTIGARLLSIRDVTDGTTGRHPFSITHPWPGYVSIAEVWGDGDDPDDDVITVVGIHAPLRGRDGTDRGNGCEALDMIIESLAPIFDSPRSEALIIAGDFNLLPADMPEILYDRFVDIVEATGEWRDPLPGCTGCSAGAHCGHLWTHRNGSSPQAAAQNIDYIFVSEGLLELPLDVRGGSQSYPDVWEVSDHAPVVFELFLEDDEA